MSDTKTSAHLLAFRKNGREILLTQRDDIPMWVIPGGHKEKKETHEETALREFKEETGYEGKITNFAAVYKSKDNKVKKYLYIGEVAGGSPKTSSETRQVVWFDTNRLPNGLTLYEQRRIADCLKFDGKLIRREYKINYFKEILNQLKHPLLFLFLLSNAINTKIAQSKRKS